MPGQTGYPLVPPPGAPGRLYGNDRVIEDETHGKAAAIILPGSFVEWVTVNGSNCLQMMQSATTGSGFAANFAGIALEDPFGYENSYVPFTVPASANAGSVTSGWPKGAVIRVARKARVWALWDGNGTLLRFGAVNIVHSSTGAFAQGAMTFTAPQTTVGNEIDIAPAGVQVYDQAMLGGTYTDYFGATRNIVPIGINLPGKY